MGLNHHVYVGAYLRITEPVIVTRVDGCKDHGRGATKYCPECGCAQDERWDDVIHAPSTDGFWDHADWIDHLHAVITSEPLSGFRGIVAKSNTGAGGMHVDRYTDEGEYDVPDGGMSMLRLAQDHRADVYRLRELGCTVTIEFGILAWSS